MARNFFRPWLGRHGRHHATSDPKALSSQPVAADAANDARACRGLAAHLTTQDVSAVPKVRLRPAVSVLDGPRNLTFSANIVSPTVALSCTAQAEQDGKPGRVFGVANEKLEIALRAALTCALPWPMISPYCKSRCCCPAAAWPR